MRSPTTYTLLLALISLLLIPASSYVFNPPIGLAYERKISFPFFSHSYFFIIATYLVDLLPWQYDIMGNAQSWEIDYTITSDNSRTSLCGSNYVLGGPKVFSNHTILKRTYTQLSDHDYVYYLIAVYAIDDWGATDSITFQFDDYTSATWYPYTYRTTYGASYCGGAATDLLIWYTGVVPHSGDSLTVTIIADMKTVSNDGPGVGFHSFSLSFPIAGLSTEPLAYACPKGQCDFGAKVCPQEQFYNGTFCSACDSSCKSCWGSKSTECFLCYQGYSYNGVYCAKCSDSNCRQCAFSPTEVCTKCNSGYYLDTDGTCKAACSNTYATVLSPSGATSKFCFDPCPTDYSLWWNGTCLPSSSCTVPPFTWSSNVNTGGHCYYNCDNYYYLYPDGSCQATCPYYPRTENGYRFCDYCADTSQYIYYGDYSCSSTCEENYIATSISETNRWCNFTCFLSGTPDYYLYQNGSCLPTCETNFVVTIHQLTNKKCTYPCETSEYLYQNGTCGSYCEAHFNTHIELTDKQFCNFPCQSGYYLYSNGTCASYCETGFTERVLQFDLQYCDFPCTSSQYLYQNGSCLSYCQQYFVSVTEGTDFNFCNYPCADSEYLYLNGSCYSSCQANFVATVQENRFQFCYYPCSKYEYLYQNGTCLSTCQTYFTVRTENTNYKFCDYPCADAEYLYQNGSCLSTCQSNFLVLSEQNKYFYCNYPCLTTEYLYENSSCLSTCETGYLVSTEQTNFHFCNYPCQSSYYLYKNGSCLSTCETYFIERVELSTMLFCDYPCSSSQYLYTDGSCRSTCLAGYKAVTESTGSRFCYFDCASGYFYYQNGSCLATCKTGYITRYEGQSYWFCDEACTSPYWMYQNESCLSTCQTYYVQRVETGPSYFCDFPCPTGEYLFDDGSCSASCPSYYLSTTQDDLNFCTFPCDSAEYYNQDGSCSSTCTSGYSFADGSNNFCWQCPTGYYYYPDQETCSTDCPYPYTVEAHSNCAISQSSTDLENSKGLSKLINVSTQLVTVSASFLTFFIWYNPSSFLLLALTKLFYYMKHMKVPYSALLQSVLDKLNIEYTYTMFKGSATDSLSENTPVGHVPYNFLKYNMHSSFFVNFFTPFIWLMIIVTFIGLIYLWKYCYRKDKDSQVLLDRIKNILKWNFILAWFFDLYDGIIIYSSLSWRATTWSSGASIWSFILATFFFVLAFVVLGKSIKIVHQLHKILQSTYRKNILQKLLQDFREKTTAYQLIYEEVKGDSIFTIVLFPIYIIRIILFYVIIGYLFEHPRAQTPLLLIVNGAMLFYLIKFKPLKEKRKQIQYVLFESVLFFNYFLVFILSLPLGSSGPSESTRTALGYIIVCLYVLTVLTVLFYLAIQCFVKSMELLKYFKTYQDNKRAQLEETPPVYVNEPEFQEYYHPGDRGLQRDRSLGGVSPGEENALFEVSDMYAYNSERRLRPDNYGGEMEMDPFDTSVEKDRANRAREKAARIRGSNKRETGRVSWK